LEALKQLDIKYVNWDLVRRIIGYISIAFLTVLHATIFGNDVLKFCVYLYRRLILRRRNINNNVAERRREEVERDRVQIELEQEYADKLDQTLERFYVKLKVANAKREQK
jgi:hypothetical protein